MSPRYRLTPNARDDVDAIGAFIAGENATAALRVLDALEQAFEELATTPGMGHTRVDLTDRPVKFLKVYSYLVVYDPASMPLTVVAVLHGARDIEQMLRDVD